MKDKKQGQGLNAIENSIHTYSRPSDLKITDMTIAVVCSNYDYPIIKIDSNQGVYGIGEVRDAGHKENALQFKSMLLGQNPCNVDMIYRAIKRFGNWGREGGGVSGIEIASPPSTVRCNLSEVDNVRQGSDAGAYRTAGARGQDFSFILLTSEVETVTPFAQGGGGF